MICTFNYQPFFKRNFRFLLCFILPLFVNSVFGQTTDADTMKAYYHDSLAIQINFKERADLNRLNIKVINPCNPSKDRYDGAVTVIEAVLKNEKYADTLVYSYPGAQSGLINVLQKELSITKIRNKQAVIIPFSYCGNFDNDTFLSFILFYDHKKYLYHIQYRCGEDMKCEVNDNLAEKLKDLPRELKSLLVKKLYTGFKKAQDF